MSASTGPAGGPSCYLGNSDAAILVRRGSRAARQALRNGLRTVTETKCLAHCGLYPSPVNGGWVNVHAGPNGATFGGVKTCSKIWLCPVCSASIRQGRAHEIELGVGVHLAMGGGVAFSTFTLPHSSKHTLRESLDALRLAYRNARQHYAVRKVMSDLGIDGTIRALEVTHGVNGWHPHLHLLWLVKRPLTAAECELLRRVWFDAYAGSLVAQGWKSPSTKRGVQVLPVSLVKGHEALSAYVAKVQEGKTSSVAREMTRGDAKRGRQASRTPMEIAEGAVSGVSRDAGLWLHYERGIKGARAIEWSRHLKGRLGVLEIDDDQLLERENSVGPVVASLSPQDFRLCVRFGQEWLLLDLAEEGGGAAVMAEVERRRSLSRISE